MEDQGRQGAEREGRGDEAEMMTRLQEEIANLPVAEHLVYMLHSLSALAVGRLGLSVDTSARRDLGQARLAIDAFKALLTVLEPVRSAGDIAAHRGMLSQLQLAYAGAIGQVGAASRTETEPSAPPATEKSEAETGPAGEPKAPAARKAPQRAKKAPAVKKAPAAHKPPTVKKVTS